jgi:xanthosine utilization system XapX-like protein
VPDGLGGPETLAWFGGVLLLLPVFVALSRKLQAIGLFVAEAVLGPPAAQRTAHAFLASAFHFGAVLLVLAFVVALSSALLPPPPVLALLGLIAALLMLRLWNHFTRVYTRAQAALEETLARPPAGACPVPPAPVLEDLALVAVPLDADSPAAGLRILDTALRGRCGATIVAVTRGGARLLNPAPDETLQSGDTLHLLATPPQADAARALLRGAGQ